ncbi:recombinase family protein [Streptomyces sp. NPDC002138]|uniref:recombinase family protein n=1 Tax=Streptomyces sp. NPDC002138 TaxID=3154410 RepID=UPI00332CC104
MARVLLTARISDDKDHSNSIQAQLEEQRAWALASGHTVVDEVEDRTVSGSVDLPDRPKLGKHLTEVGRQAWDTLVVSTQDRLSRDDRHFNAFVGNVLDWGKGLIVLDDPSFDISTPMGRWIAQGKAVQAATELDKIKKRVTRSRRFLRKHGRWAGGTPPYGYQKVKNVPRAEASKCADCGVWLEPNPEGKGYHLEPDPVSASTVVEIVARMLGGDSLTNVCRDLTARKVLSPWDYALTKRRTPKEPKGAPWDVSGLRRILTNVALIGQTTHATERDQNGKALKVEIVRGEDGKPLQVAIPIVAPADFRRLQEMLTAQRAKPGMSRSKYTSYMLRQVGFCGYHVAGVEAGQTFEEIHARLARVLAEASIEDGADPFSHPIYGQASTKRGKTTRYYRCKTYLDCIDGKNFRADEIEAGFEATFMDVVGDLPHTHRVVIPGEDHAAELAEVLESIGDLEEDRYEHGLYKGPDGAERYRRMMGRLEERKTALEGLPSRKAEVREEPSGMTIREYWASLDYADRGHWLRSIGMRSLVTRQTDNMPAPGSPVIVTVFPPGFRENALRWAQEQR